MKHLVLVLAVVLLATAVLSAAATAQNRNVTFIVNSATVPDTVNASYTMQIRGNIAPLTWGNDTGGQLTNIGGDYWSVTLAFPVGSDLRFKIFAGTDGWEQDVAGVQGGTNRGYFVADVDTVLPVQFFNNRAAGTPQYFRPWTEVPDSFINIYFRVNMEGAIANGISCFNNDNDTVGVRGGGPAGGDLNWSPTFYLVKEQPASNGGFGYPASRFWSGRIRIPRSAVSAGDAVPYKFIVGYDWTIPGCSNQRSEQLPDPPYPGGNRRFFIPSNMQDTTLSFVYYQDTRATARANADTVIATFRANMQRAIQTGGFQIGDTVVVRTGYYSTAVQGGREKRLLRQGLSTIYAATDTLVTDIDNVLDYQYYVIKFGQEVRENYYNFFYDGEISAEAERRQVIVPDTVFTVFDTSTSITQARRVPVFPNGRTLARNVQVRWEVDIRPAIYQVAAGDTLRDIQGSFNIYPADIDSILGWGLWMNGPAVGGWGNPGGGDWGIGLQNNLEKKLYDDGTNGDVTPGDSIFSRFVLASPDSIGIGSKGQVGQTFKFGVRGGDNEGGRGGFGNNHLENIDDTNPTYTLRSQFGSINPAFYDAWDYDCGCPATSSVKPEPGIPGVFALKQNYPNPFNPSTKIDYSLPVQSFVTLKVYDMLGQEVATLVNEAQHASNYSVRFDARNVSSGVYFYRLVAGDFTAVRKLVVLK